MTEPSDLYGLPLERFVPERTAQAKALRSQGDRDEAARLAKLAKPSVAAWAVNQLVRTQHRAVEELFAAGDALQKAQQDILAGHASAAALREAVERERSAASALLDAARGLLSSEGQSLTPATLERVSDTLHAAAIDDGARREVQDGCLTRELRHVGLGGGLVTDQPPAQPRGRARPTKTGARTKDKAGSDGRRERAARETEEAAGRERERAARETEEASGREREQRRKAARADAATARRALDAAERNLRSSEERRDRAAAALREADDAVSAAEARVEEASRAVDEAQRAVDQI